MSRGPLQAEAAAQIARGVSLLRARWKLVEASTGVRPFLEYESQFSRYAVQAASPPAGPVSGRAGTDDLVPAAP